MHGDKVREIELALFTPLDFSTTGGMGKEVTVFYHRLADLLASKHGWTYILIASPQACIITSWDISYNLRIMHKYSNTKIAI